jgi:hypothetical protein
MMRVAMLKAEARKSAEWRGHDMAPFKDATGFVKSRPVFRSTCRKCGMHVDVSTNPAPNEIDIGGSAVALNCKSIESTIEEV